MSHESSFFPLVSLSDDEGVVFSPQNFELILSKIVFYLTHHQGRDPSYVKRSGEVGGAGGKILRYAQEEQGEKFLLPVSCCLLPVSCKRLIPRFNPGKLTLIELP